MSETNEDTSNWWGSWITSAKSKSASVFEAVKKDLDEISSAVRTEVSNASAVIGETLKLDEPESTASTVKRSLSSFLGQVSEALVPSIDDDDAEAVLITNDGTLTLTGFQKHLAELQANDDTYLKQPEDNLAENYKRWLECIEQDQFTQNRLTKHLSSSEILNEKYLSLVPEQVSHMEFWKRYLFKRAILEDALANAEIAERKAKSEEKSIKTVSPKKTIIQTEQPKKVYDSMDSVGDDAADLPKKDEIPWDQEDFGSAEITEEEQARLLEEYEREMHERDEKKKSYVPLEEKLRQEEAERKDKLKKVSSTNTQKKPINSNKKSSPPTNTTTKKSGKTNNKNVEKSTTAQNDKDANSPIEAMQKDHFTADNKDETASNSDESWEKDFDLADK